MIMCNSWLDAQQLAIIARGANITLKAAEVYRLYLAARRSEVCGAEYVTYRKAANALEDLTGCRVAFGRVFQID